MPNAKDPKIANPLTRKRNIDSVDCVQGHLAAAGEEACSTVETRLLPTEAVANRSWLQAEADAWLQELGETPPGNGEQASLWQVMFWNADLCHSIQKHKQRLPAFFSVRAMHLRSIYKDRATIAVHFWRSASSISFSGRPIVPTCQRLKLMSLVMKFLLQVILLHQDAHWYPELITDQEMHAGEAGGGGDRDF